MIAILKESLYVIFYLLSLRCRILRLSCSDILYAIFSLNISSVSDSECWLWALTPRVDSKRWLRVVTPSIDSKSRLWILTPSIDSKHWLRVLTQVLTLSSDSLSVESDPEYWHRVVASSFDSEWWSRVLTQSTDSVCWLWALTLSSDSEHWPRVLTPATEFEHLLRVFDSDKTTEQEYTEINTKRPKWRSQLSTNSK